MARKGKSSFTQKEVSQVVGGHPPGQPEEGEGTHPGARRRRTRPITCLSSVGASEAFGP